ncbi:hypothetical protein [uncultured Flavonifractor sp.]|uniref:hypothetical protein n=1 Tax=uncultured Flavonifractor sp. TaxID=1193534 RepID=UPI0026141452|nr:hypothetical protein [uncultured Flavonifractor sp.]
MEKGKYDFLYWKYDGGQVGSLLVLDYSLPRLDCRCPDFFKNGMKPNKHSKEIKDLERRNKIKVDDRIREDLPVGASSYFKEYEKKKNRPDINKCYKEFMKMFSSEKGTKAQMFIAKLLAVVLSSYFIGGALQKKSVVNTYPLPNISAALYAVVRKHGSDEEPYTLRQLCRSLMVSTTSRKNKKFKVKAPTVLPVNGKQSILDEAWLRPRKYKGDYKWPAPYRDMAVMLDGRFFRRSDINDFLSLNPWCTAVIYTNKFEHTRFGVKLDGKDVLDQLDIDWDIDAVNRLIARYIPYIYSTFDTRSSVNFMQLHPYVEVWAEAGIYLNKYMNNRPKTEGRMGYSERFKQRILLSALISFVDFLHRYCDISLSDACDLKRELLEALLPGCCPPKPEEGLQVIQYPSFDEIVKELISLENQKHFYPITEKGQVYPTELPDGTDIWGYVKLYKDKESDEKKINISFFQETLIHLVQEKYPQYGYFGKTLTNIRKEKTVYLHKTPSIKCRTVEGGKQESIPGCRLILDELPVSTEVKEAFAQMLTE